MEVETRSGSDADEQVLRLTAALASMITATPMNRNTRLAGRVSWAWGTSMKVEKVVCQTSCRDVGVARRRGIGG